MNCREFEERCIESLEGTLDASLASELAAHLEDCATCRAARDELKALTERLSEEGEACRDVDLVPGVMTRIERVQPPARRHPVAWLLGLAGTGLAAACLLVAVLAPPHNAARAAEALARGAQVMGQLKGVHFLARMRSGAREPFCALSPDQDFQPLEVWRESTGLHRWRVEKPGRILTMDGQETLLQLVGVEALREAGDRADTFDAAWVLKLADPGAWLDAQVREARANHWKLRLNREKGPDGRTQKVVTLDVPSRVPADDYLARVFLDTSETRREFRFDAETGRLAQARIYLKRDRAQVLVFELQRIDVDPALASECFTQVIPPSTPWAHGAPKSSVSMSAEQAARAFFEACAREDWSHAEVFNDASFTASFKARYGGLQILSLGESFTSKLSSAPFVPYAIRLRSGEIKRHNLALRQAAGGAWLIDGGI